jgi:glycosyltransferase involved in cell wall biosynthesis
MAGTYANHGRFEIIRNAVPRGFLGIEHFDSDVVGWGGSLHSHPRDMQPVGPAIAQITRGGAVDFCVVGPGAGVKAALGLDREPLSTGPVDIKDWPVALAQNIGIGIAPLADTQFNAAKSWLKILEYSALGIPWVASPRAEYERFAIEGGGGLLAERPKDWLKMLKWLVESESMREEVGAFGRATVEANHTIEGRYAEQMWEAWSRALLLERRGRRGVNALTGR